MRTYKNLIFLSAALGMIVYAVPLLKIGASWSAPTLFALVWIGFSLLIVASHLHDILRVDDDVREELMRIRRLRRRRLHQLLTGK